MKKIFSLPPLLCACLLLACTVACVDDKVEDTYLLQSIEYTLEAPSDGITESTVTIPYRTWENTGDQEMTIEIDPFDGDQRTITLTSNDPQAFGWKGSQDISLPRPWVEGTDAGHYDNTEDYVPYLKGTNTYETGYVEKKNITIPPHGEGSVQGAVTFERVQVTYLLTLKGQLTGEERTVKGTLVYETPSSSYVGIGVSKPQ